MKYIQAPGSLMILGPHKNADKFNQQISSYGGLLYVTQCLDGTKIEFLPVASHIDSIVRLWTEDAECRDFFNTINAGFIVNPVLNAFAYVDGSTKVLAITSGLVWQLHELWFTLFSHPEFLKDFGGKNINPPFSKLHNGFNPVYGNVSDSSKGLLWRPHPRPFNDFRLALAHIMSQMSIEFVFYHELGHLIGGHSKFLKEINPLFRMNELESKRRNSKINKELLQAVEYDADGFAVQVSVGNGVMLKYFERQQNTPSHKEEVNVKELAYYLWAMSLAGVMRLYSQQGRTIAEHELATHPHPLSRALAISMTIATSTALKDDPDKERIIDLCCKAAYDLSGYWRKYEIPGYKYDTVEDDNLLMKVVESTNYATKVLKDSYITRKKYEDEHILNIVRNGAYVDLTARPNS